MPPDDVGRQLFIFLAHRPAGDDAFVVNAYVDAENAFGAHLRHTFACSVTHVGGADDTWRLTSLKID